MMKAIDRLYEYLEYKGIKPTNLEREIQLSNGYFSIQRKRKADIGETALKKITDYCRDLNPTWLLTGSGEMLLDFTKGITGGADPVMDKEMNEGRDETLLLYSLMNSNKKVKLISDKHDSLTSSICLINAIIEEYEIYMKMSPILSCYLKKEIGIKELKEKFKSNFLILSEITSILEPYQNTLSEIHQKLSDFDERHDMIYYIDEETLAEFENFKKKQ